MNPTAVTSRAAAALVAAVAGFASYNHIVSVATAAGEHRAVAMVLPLGIDGLIVVGTMAMLEDKRAHRIPRPMARVALGFGIVATIAANVASAQPTATARLVAAVPALAFLIAVEVLAHRGKLRTEAPATEAASPAVITPPTGDSLTAIADAIVDAIPTAAVATPRPATDPTARPAKRTTPRSAKTRQGSAERVATAVAKKPAMTQAEAAKVLGLSERTVQRYWPKPATTVNGHQPQEVSQ